MGAPWCTVGRHGAPWGAVGPRGNRANAYVCAEEQGDGGNRLGYTEGRLQVTLTEQEKQVGEQAQIKKIRGWRSEEE